MSNREIKKKVFFLEIQGLTPQKSCSGERLQMGIMGSVGFMGTPGIAGLLAEGVRVRSHGIGSSPSHEMRVRTYYTHHTHHTHVRVPP